MLSHTTGKNRLMEEYLLDVDGRDCPGDCQTHSVNIYIEYAEQVHRGYFRTALTNPIVCDIYPLLFTRPTLLSPCSHCNSIIDNGTAGSVPVQTAHESVQSTGAGVAFCKNVDCFRARLCTGIHSYLGYDSCGIQDTNDVPNGSSTGGIWDIQRAKNIKYSIEDTYARHVAVLTSAVHFLHIFLQANCTGPPFQPVKVSKIIDGEQNPNEPSHSAKATDSSTDTGCTAGTDTGCTAGTDTGCTAGTDTGCTAGTDTGCTAGTDTGCTAGTDTGCTAGTDTGCTAGTDTGCRVGEVDECRSSRSSNWVWPAVLLGHPDVCHVDVLEAVHGISTVAEGVTARQEKEFWDNGTYFAMPVGLLKNVVDSMSIDGEEVHERIVGVAYLWIAIYILDVLYDCTATGISTGISTGTSTSSGDILQTLTIWRGRAAFTWQKCLAGGGGGGYSLSPKLYRRSVEDLMCYCTHWMTHDGIPQAASMPRSIPFVSGTGDDTTGTDKSEVFETLRKVLPKDSDVLNSIKTQQSAATDNINFTGGGHTYNAAGTQTNVAGTQTDAAGTQTNVAGTQTNASGTQTNDAGTQTNAAGTKTNAAGTQTNVAGTQTNVAGTQTNVAGTQTSVSAMSISSRRYPRGSSYLCSALMELCNRLTYYENHNSSDLILGIAQSCVGYDFKLTGAMGRRRAHQIRDVPQLVVKVTPLNNADIPSVVKGSGSVPLAVDKGAVQLRDVDPDSDLLEQPLLTDDNDSKAAVSPLTVTLQSLLLVHSSSVLRKMPAHDELALEQLRAFVTRALVLPDTNSTPADLSLDSTTTDFAAPHGSKNKLDTMLSSNWLVFSAGLWFRCKSEFHRSKTAERSVLQQESLIEQFHDLDPSAGHRLLFVHQLMYPLRFQAKVDFGRRMMNIGAVLTASNSFVELKLWEEAVECLSVAARRTEGLKILEQRLAIRPTPRLWAIHGDITQDLSSYTKSWKLSNFKFGRAQRALGHQHFKAGRLQEAIDAYSLALAINPTHHNVWFAKGCAEMKVELWDSAVTSFGRVVALEAENGEAWANMAGTLARGESWQKAKLCAHQAVKYQRDNWRIWDSYMKMGIKTRDVAVVVMSLRSLLELLPAREYPVWALEYATVAALDSVDNEQTTSKFDSVLALLTEVLNRISDNPDIYAWRAALLQSKGQLCAAHSAFTAEFRARLAQLEAGESAGSSLKEVVQSLAECVEKLALIYRQLRSADDTHAGRDGHGTGSSTTTAGTAVENREVQIAQSANGVYTILVAVLQRLLRNQEVTSAVAVQIQRLREASELIPKLSITQALPHNDCA